MGFRLATVLVAAAISLKAPLEDAARQFGAADAGEPIAFTFGSSGQLAAQIEQGAPVDLFVSASPVDTERLAIAGKIDLATRTALASNRLVVVLGQGVAPPADLPGLAAARFARIAVGNPKTVPAGRYARQALVAAGIIDGIEKRLVYGENVRQVLEFVVRGDADAGIVYATDLPTGDDTVNAAFEVPERLHTSIVYEGAVIAGAGAPARARAFLGFLASPVGRALFAEHGFLPPGTAASK